MVAMSELDVQVTLRGAPPGITSPPLGEVRRTVVMTTGWIPPPPPPPEEESLSGVRRYVPSAYAFPIRSGAVMVFVTTVPIGYPRGVTVAVSFVPSHAYTKEPSGDAAMEKLSVSMGSEKVR